MASGINLSPDAGITYMKLIQRTYQLTVLWLIPAVILGSIFCFHMIEYIAYEETDEFLTYEMERILDHHAQFGELPEYHQAAAILPDVRHQQPFFKDTLILEPADNEMVPHRELHFSIRHKGSDFGIVLRHLLLGHDDIALGTSLIIVGLILLTGIFVFIIIRNVAQRIWQPFYTTLRMLTTFKIHEPIPSFPKTQIDEFNTLHTALTGLLQKISDDYRHTKEFNSNASHELQTHLAIIKAGAEKLMNSLHAEDSGQLELHKIYEAAGKLSQAQKSLLLLSKISNREFQQEMRIDLKEITMQAIALFTEVAALRGIRITQSLETCLAMMDSGLADILIQNLIKNAVKHNVQNGYVQVRLTPHLLRIENSGTAYDGDSKALMERFARGPGGNFGIGLAIVREICEYYHFGLDYVVQNATTHVITVRFSK